MKEYRKINDLPEDLKKEICENDSFFNDFDGKSLDEQQRIACVLNDCDLEIIAGAGTGKTHTLLAKASYLIEYKNILPDEILFLSFSKSCVEELIERLNYNVPTSTIHAFGLSLIDEYREKEIFNGYGFRKILDEYLKTASDKEKYEIKTYCEINLKSEDMIKLKELDSEAEKFNHLISKSRISYKIKSFIELFKGKGYTFSDFKEIKSKCKNEFETKDGNYYTNENYLKNISFIQLVEPVYRFYESYLFKNHLIDFNDMINKAIDLIENGGISNDFKYIFVDEYQDMSYKNFQFIKTLKQACNAHLVVVGDDWQSIYGFRDSDITLFNDFCDYFPNANRVFIEKTYRNPQELIDIAGNFIMKNESQFKKSLKSDKFNKKPIKIVYGDNCDAVYNLISNLSKDSERVFILGRHNGDIDKFIFDTNLVKKSKNEYKQITDEYEIINNVEYRTIHKSKGLEADYVILINVFDQQVGFPNKLYPPYFMNLMHGWDYEKKLEEERRLFYVAITRAKKGVYIFTKDYKQSEYIDELIEDNLNDLEIIDTENNITYSHLKEFNKVESPKKVKTKQSKVNVQLIEIDDMENADGIEIKANLKDMGNKLIKSKDYDGAIDFYNKLLTNMYFLNDYYPYRKLVEVYRKDKDSKNVIQIIKEFFESEIYCNEAQLLWFKLEFKKACKYTNVNFNEFNNYLDYFNEHGLKNKDKQNTPVPIAARIQNSKYQVKLMSFEDFDKKSKKKELEYNYKFARLYESSRKALFYFEQLWNQDGFNRNLTAYKRLCSFYDDVGDYEKVLEVANAYFESDARRTKSSPDWFKKKIKKAESMLSNNNNHNLNLSNDDISSNENKLTFDEKIDLKIELYNEGKKLLKNDIDKAIKFYKDLINHKLFINDYHPYLKLSQAYHEDGDYRNEVKTIEEFFKSGRYCRNSTLKWFKKRLEDLDKIGYYDYSQIDGLEKEFKKYGGKNQKLTTIPVPLASDIKSCRKNLNKNSISVNFDIYDDEIKVPDNLSYDEKIDFKYDLILKGKRLMEDKYYDRAIAFYSALLNHELFINDYHPHFKLSKCYGKTKRYDRQIECISNFFKSGIYAPDNIYKAFKRILKGLNTHGYYDYSLFDVLEKQYLKNGALNRHLSDEPVLKAIEIMEAKKIDEVDTSEMNFGNDFKIKYSQSYSRDFFNKLAKDIESHPDFISDRELSNHGEDDFIEITKDYGKINEKVELKNIGKELENVSENEAIRFYESLKTNPLFIHDYYPYRRQCILFKNKIKDDQKDLDAIIDLFNHEVYCNPHQYIWLYNKLLELIDKLNLNENEINKIDNLLDDYVNNEEKYFELQNTPVPIAERIIKDENGLKLLSQEKYDFMQDVYYINELGVGYIRRGEYKTAIEYYLDLLESDVLYYKYHAYKQLGRIYDEMNNPREFKRLYEKLSDN